MTIGICPICGQAVKVTWPSVSEIKLSDGSEHFIHGDYFTVDACKHAPIGDGFGDAYERILAWASAISK